MTTKTEWLEMLHASTIVYPNDSRESAQPLRDAALHYAKQLGWLSPEESVEMDKAMLEYASVHEATRREREEMQGLKDALKKALHALEQVQHLL